MLSRRSAHLSALLIPPAKNAEKCTGALLLLEQDAPVGQIEHTINFPIVCGRFGPLGRRGNNQCFARVQVKGGSVSLLQAPFEFIETPVQGTNIPLVTLVD